MKKIESINSSGLDSGKYYKYSGKYMSSKVDIMKRLLNIKIEKLQIRLAELEEVKVLMNQEAQIYLIKDNDLHYGYIDSEGKNYEYKIINGKPILIDEDFNLYEIIEYTDLDDIGQDKGNSNCTVAWIDKVVKVKRVKK